MHSRLLTGRKDVIFFWIIRLREGCGLISSNDFCKLLITLKAILLSYTNLITNHQNHLMTINVKRVLRDFVLDTQGSKVTYAYSTAFQALLGDMETAKKVSNVDIMVQHFCCSRFICVPPVGLRRRRFPKMSSFTPV